MLEASWTHPLTHCKFPRHFPAVFSHGLTRKMYMETASDIYVLTDSPSGNLQENVLDFSACLKAA